MVVIIIIMAVISSVAVPAYARFHQRALFQQGVHQVAELLTWARDAAVQSEGESTVRFDQQADTLSVTIEMPDTSGDLPTAMQVNQEVPSASDARSFVLGENMTISEFSARDPQTDSG